MLIESENRKRGLTISQTSFQYLTQGSFAAIFVDKFHGRIRKIFWELPSQPKQYLDNVFNLEISAYDIAMKVTELREVVPHFYGKCAGEDVVDGSGTNVSAEFRCDLSYEMEFIDGDFVKIGSVGPSQVPPNEISRIKRLFCQNDICHVDDACVLIQNNRIAKIIDFAMDEIEPWHK